MTFVSPTEEDLTPEVEAIPLDEIAEFTKPVLVHDIPEEAQ